MKIRAIPLKTPFLKTATEKPLSWKLLAATFFGVGLIRKAPGTFGSLVAMLVLLLPQQYIFPALLFGIFIGSAVSFSAISAAEEEWGSDSGRIVIDEAVGMWIVLLHPATQHSFLWAIIAFALFRVFDILKPWPINLLNKKEGPFFVLADDILAGIFSLVSIGLAFKIFF
ncbi:MAG: phosphatidylglycerophosphatase A [Bacteroidota bacterium]